MIIFYVGLGIFILILVLLLIYYFFSLNIIGDILGPTIFLVFLALLITSLVEFENILNYTQKGDNII